MTPRASGGPPAVELMNAPGVSVTPPPVTISRLATLVVSIVIGAAISMLPVTNGVPLTLRYPTCTNPAVIEARSADARPMSPGEPAVPSEIPLAAVNGPTITVPVVLALMVPGASDTLSATIAILPAAAAAAAVLSMAPLFVKVAPAPPDIIVIEPPPDATEDAGLTVRLTPPVVATVSALPFVVTPDNGLANGPVVMTEGVGIPVTGSNATPMVGAASAPILRGAASFR